MKLDPVSVKINNGVVKFVMNNPTLTEELTKQLGELNGEIQWKHGIPFVTIVQKSEDVVVSKWSEKCKSLVTKFFQRFHKESYEIQDEIKVSVRNHLNDLKQTICPSVADCWLASNDRWLVVVGLKENLSSVVVKFVENFLQKLKEENEKLTEIVKFVPVSTDYIEYIEHVQFLEILKQDYPGLIDANFTEAKNRIRLKGSDEDISAANQQYEDLVKALSITELELSTHIVKFLFERFDFIEERLSERKIVSVILVESKSSVKIVARTEEREAVKECLCSCLSDKTVDLPPTNECILDSKKWFDISETIKSEELIDYQICSEGEIKRGITLYGATHLVENYEKIVADFIKSQKIESCVMHIPPDIARFMKEKMGKEVEIIKSDLKEEQVKIEIGLGKMNCTGTLEGIRKSKERIKDLKDDIEKHSKDYSFVGVDIPFSDDDGQRIIKSIEVESDVKIEVIKKDSLSVEIKSTQADVEAIRAQREEAKKVKQTPPAPMDPFDQCNFTTNKGLNVSWKYGNIAAERVSMYCVNNTKGCSRN